MGPSLFHRGFVGIPTDLSSDPNTWGWLWIKGFRFFRKNRILLKKSKIVLRLIPTENRFR
ncbi:hypothetical protein LEP1GSC036_0305 [Leptospira weilii str. 2006001853]|uniref:Uncharacterized protein n=1 Tax=Leptospira weilii str. 2006001853 TaxID=1001589 RepID=A0A828Z4H5_9LEPT|nr:hypothetical protein LEP1GSC036_0305 [Leptospira weilii str. 2006001853]